MEIRLPRGELLVTGLINLTVLGKEDGPTTISGDPADLELLAAFDGCVSYEPAKPKVKRRFSLLRLFAGMPPTPKPKAVNLTVHVPFGTTLRLQTDGDCTVGDVRGPVHLHLAGTPDATVNIGDVTSFAGFIGARTSLKFNSSIPRCKLATGKDCYVEFADSLHGIDELELRLGSNSRAVSRAMIHNSTNVTLSYGAKASLSNAEGTFTASTAKGSVLTLSNGLLNMLELSGDGTFFGDAVVTGKLVAKLNNGDAHVFSVVRHIAAELTNSNVDIMEAGENLGANVVATASRLACHAQLTGGVIKLKDRSTTLFHGYNDGIELEFQTNCYVALLPLR